MREILNENGVVVGELKTICGSCFVVNDNTRWMPKTRTFKTEKRALNYAREILNGVSK